jgi:DNA-binding transcriptional ArsR family regulator
VAGTFDDRTDADFIGGVTMFDGKNRQLILRVLVRLHMATKAEIEAACGLNGMTLTRHLEALEDLGVVDIDVPRGQRQGRRVNIELNEAAYVSRLTAWYRQMAISG